MDLIRAMLERANWARAQACINPEFLGKELHRVAVAIDKMYKGDPTLLVTDPENLRVAFFLDNPGLKPGDVTAYNIIFDRLRDEKGGKSFEDVLESLVVYEGLATIASTATAALAKPVASALDDIEALVTKYDAALCRALTTDEVFVTAASVGAPPSRTSGLRFPIAELDRAAGPLQQGDFAWICARMEMGKTTLMAQCVASWLVSGYEMDRPILWVNNEERSDKLFRRVMQSRFGITTADLFSDWTNWLNLWNTIKGTERLLVTKQGENNSTREIEGLCDRYKPAVIIIDQLDKVRGFGKDGSDEWQRLGKLATWARYQAAKWGPVIAVSQLDFTAEGLKFPTMSSMRGSKVDKAAEADLIITMGADDRNAPTRGFSFEKNKLDGADELYRHDKFELTIDAPLARFGSPGVK